MNAPSKPDDPGRPNLPREFLFCLGTLVLLLAYFALLRLGLIWRNWELARLVPGKSLLDAFLVGARFDLAVSCFLLIPLALAAYLPRWGLAASARARKICLRISLALMFLVTFLSLAEFEFFREFQTRYNQLFFQYLDQPGTVAGMIWRQYPVFSYVTATLTLLAAWGLLLRLLLRKLLAEVRPASPARRGSSLVLLGALIVFGIRGGFQNTPLNWGNAFHSPYEFVNQASLNGLYTLGNTVREHFYQARLSESWRHALPLPEARAMVRKLLLAPNEILLDPENRTLLRRVTRPDNEFEFPPGPRPPNVVLVIMESFSARFCGAAGCPDSQTPEFDRLAREGLLFDRFLSSGTHTHQGVFATLLGFPNLPGYEYLMNNTISNQPFTSLPGLLGRQGYRTLFLYNGDLSWDNMRGFFRQHGVTHFYGGPDFPSRVPRDPVWGVRDPDLFDHVNEELVAADKDGPVGAIVLTLSNHMPFNLPDPCPFPPATTYGELNPRMNAIRYADWALGRFMTMAKKEDYFSRTLFVFLGDHGFHGQILTEANLVFHHVPLLFYAPTLLPPGGKVRHEVAGQTDVAPTILGLLGNPEPFACWGRNLFARSPAGRPFTVFKSTGGGRAVAMITDDRLAVKGTNGQWTLWRYDLGWPPSASLDAGPDNAPVLAELSRQTTAYVQCALDDLLNHRAGTPAASP